MLYKKANDNPKESMHHKFALVDNKFVFNGSLNWSEKGVTKNHENITILDGETIAKQFTSQFDELWIKFGNIIIIYDIEQKGKFFNEKKYIPKYYYRNYNQYKNYFDRNGYRQDQFYEFPDDDDSGSEYYYDDYEGREMVNIIIRRLHIIMQKKAIAITKRIVGMAIIEKNYY